jgi:pimeloyl-ACP methyl ester carboxylesterase
VGIVISRRNLLLGASFVLRADIVPLKHLQVVGEWCFIGVPVRKSNRAVMILDGNGTTVGPTSSSWEKNAACAALSQALIDAGFVVAQSNRTATPDNGMWGNPPSQQAVIALMAMLRHDYGINRFTAMTVSAGSITLLNLLLDGKAEFEAAALFSPVISLESMYRCPGGFNRVKWIAAAYKFQPARPCPGDPENDEAFRHATDGFDPMRRIRSGLPKSRGGLRTSWMVLYHRGDPKVLPPENGARFVRLLRANAAAVKEVAIDGNTHNSDDLMRGNLQDVVRLMKG